MRHQFTPYRKRGGVGWGVGLFTLSSVLGLMLLTWKTPSPFW